MSRHTASLHQCGCVFIQWQFLTTDEGETNLLDDPGWTPDEGKYSTRLHFCSNIADPFFPE